MELEREYNNYKAKNLDILELEELGIKLVQQVVRHMGMVRYKTSKIKDYDLKDTDIGYLTDVTVMLLDGVQGRGNKHYNKLINLLIERVIKLPKGRDNTSVVNNLKKEFVTEIRKVISEETDYSSIWDL